jgi:hypothetical protein
MQPAGNLPGLLLAAHRQCPLGIHRAVLGLGMAHVEAPIVALCERAGGLWHESAPMRAGRVLSPLALPGCMIGMGQGTSHIVDPRELTAFISPTVTIATVDRTEFPAAQTGTLAVRIEDLSGALVAGLTPEHDRPLHAIAIGRDLRSFTHAHPLETESASGAVFRVPITLPEAGKYVLGLDWMVRGVPQAQVLTLTATGTGEGMTAADNALTPLSQEADGLAVSLSLPWRGLRAKKEQRVRFAVTRGGAPVTTLQPYLAAPMHIAVTSADTRRFFHAHGELPPLWIDAIFHPRIPGAGHAHASVPDTFGPDIDAYLTFPEPGRYALFGEFQEGGRLRRARFVVDVGA